MADKTYKFKIPLSDGTVKELPFTVPQGEKGDPGVDVTSAAINDEGHLIITLSDGQTIDAGVAKGADGKSSYIQLALDGNNGAYINITNDGEETQSVYIANGKTPLVSIKDIDGGHRVSFYVNEVEVNSFDVMDGEKGDQGDSPEVTVEEIEGGHRVTIGGESFDVMDGTGGSGAGATYIKDGSNYGALRTVSAAAESDDYKLGSYALAQGVGTKAPGVAAHAEGAHTIAASAYQHVEGTYNVPDEDIKYIHIDGNGTASAPSNSHTRDWDGNAWFRGKVFVGGESMDDPNAKELGGGLPTGSTANQMLVTDADGNAGWQNRTHWKDFSNVILPETTVNVNADMGFAPILTPLGLELGKDYLVIWNGVKYNCTAVLTAYYGQPLVCIGNTGAMDTSYAPTGEPFIIGDFGSDAMGLGFTSAAIPLDGSASASVEIREVVYHKIDNNYLPNNIGEATWVSRHDLTVNPDFANEIIVITSNQTAKLTEDTDLANALRSCACIEIHDSDTDEIHDLDKKQYKDAFLFGNLSIVGYGDDTGEPFVVMVSARNPESVILYLKEAATSTRVFTIRSIYNERNTIPPAFLPPIPVEIPTTDVNVTATLEVNDIAGQLTIYLSNGTKYKVAIESTN